jgi:glycogen operon protein
VADLVFLGARFCEGRAEVEFRVWAARATRIEVWVYAHPTKAAPVARRTMIPSVVGVFSARLGLSELRQTGLGDFLYYGYRAWGPNWVYEAAWAPGTDRGFSTDVDEHGNRFNPNKLLLDPYALEVSHNPLTPDHRDLSAYQSGSGFRLVDTGPFAPKGIVLDVPSPAFGVKPERPLKDEVIYEAHLRGLTRNDPTVPEGLRGTYAGAMARVGYLRDLGVTAIELLPVHEMQNAVNDIADLARFHDYWGYDPVSYFAPCRRYAADSSPGGPTRELIAMVKAFHEAGLKVYIDVVYNHHQEGDVDPETSTVGAIYSLRGLANGDYYEDLGDSGRPNLYENDNGVGPNLNVATNATRNLIIASLAYYTHAIGVDGFRFDLAAVLGNTQAAGGYRFGPDEPDGVLQRAVRELPARPAAGGPGVDLIAEPYTDRPKGEEQGNFPAGWSEWNDRFRDAVRASQNKVGIVPVTPGQLATRWAGSDDLFRARGRRPQNSINYVVCHDGLTLRDLHSTNDIRNDQPPPFGPSEGGRSAEAEMCWDHGGDVVAQKQAERTSIALLLLSAGVPMISAGAEMRRTLRGNNNPYNLDTVANWIDWSLLEKEGDLFVFTRRLLHFRRAHPALRPADFFLGTDAHGTGAKDIAWYRDDGREVDAGYFADPTRHFLAFAIDGVEARDPARWIYVAYNGFTEMIAAALPPPRSGTRWVLVADTQAAAASYGFMHEPGSEPLVTSPTIAVAGRSVVLLIGR